MTDIDFSIKSILQDIYRDNPNINQLELLSETERRLKERSDALR